MSLKFRYELLRRLTDATGEFGGGGGDGEQAPHELVTTAISMVIERPARDRRGVGNAPQRSGERRRVLQRRQSSREYFSRAQLRVPMLAAIDVRG